MICWFNDYIPIKQYTGDTYAYSSRQHDGCKKEVSVSVLVECDRAYTVSRHWGFFFLTLNELHIIKGKGRKGSISFPLYFLVIELLYIQIYGMYSQSTYMKLSLYNFFYRIGDLPSPGLVCYSRDISSRANPTLACFLSLSFTFPSIFEYILYTSILRAWSFGIFTRTHICFGSL